MKTTPSLFSRHMSWKGSATPGTLPSMLRASLLLVVLVAAAQVACGGKKSDGSNAPSDGSDAGGCIPKTCDSAIKNCGEILDGCGGILNCGSCADGETCGGSGTANVCGPGTCEPKSCSDMVANCGDLSDGCSKVMNCGGCDAPETCGGGGAPNLCGSTVCTMSCPGGATCQGGMCVGADYANLHLELPPVARVVVMPPPFDDAYCDANLNTWVRFRHVYSGRTATVAVYCKSKVGAGPSTAVTLGEGVHAVSLLKPQTSLEIQAIPDRSFSGDVVLDLAPVLVPVQGKITSNGGALPIQCLAGKVRFESTTHKDIAIASVDCVTGAFALRLAPDTYRVSLQPGNGDNASFEAPENVAITGPTASPVIDVPITIVSGVLRKNGSDFITCLTRSLFFTDVRKNRFSASFSCGGKQQNYSVALQKGVHNVALWGGSDGVFLANEIYSFPETVTVSGGSLQTLDLNVPVTNLSGTVSVNGGQLGIDPGGIFLHFHGPNTLTIIPVATLTTGWTYSVPLYSGTYSYVEVENRDSYHRLPPKGPFTIQSAPVTLAPGSQTLNFDLKPTNTSGRVLRSGGPLGATCADYKVSTTNVSLSAGPVTLVCDGPDWTWSGFVYAGPARVQISTWPAINVTLTATEANGTPMVPGIGIADLNYVFARILGEVSQNGQPITGCQNNTVIRFIPADGQGPSYSTTVQCLSGVWKYLANIPPDIAFQTSINPVTTDPPRMDVPQPTWNPKITVTGSSTTDTVLNFDIPSVTVAGLLTSNGLALSGACTTAPVLRFTEIFSKKTYFAQMTCGASYGSYRALLHPGVYQVDYFGNGTNTPLTVTPLIERLEVKLP